MTTKTKTTSIILSTLIIGMAIGALISGTLRHEREQRFERMPPNERFFLFMERIIRPTEQQREEYDRIIAKRSEQISKLHQEHENEMFALYDSMRTELQSILTEEQRSRFEAHLAKGTHKLAEMRLAVLTEQLDLDKTQQEQIKEILKQLERPPPRHLKRFHRKPGKPNRTFRNRFIKIQKEIEAVLRPEQLDKYHKMRRELGPPFGRPPFRKPRFERAPDQIEKIEIN